LECSGTLDQWLTAFKEICHSTRKLRLFAAACSWRTPEEFSAATLLEAERYLDRLASGARRRVVAQSSSFKLSQVAKKVAVSRAIEVAERHADGQATDEELRLACWYLEHYEMNSSPEFMACSFNPYQSFIAQLADIRMAQDRVECARTIGKYEWPQRMDIQDRWCSNVHGVLRDMADPWPVGLVTLDPAWLAWNSGTVFKMAKVIYDEHRFDEMPALGDALEDAGCEEKKVLNHCREPGEHWRGCWLIDLLLGKC
jgi:hypothetical protein